MPYILLGEPTYIKHAHILSNHGFTPIPLPPEQRLNPIVSTHADTLIWSDGKAHIANADYIKKLPSELTRYFTQASDTPYGEYPTDTAFNALSLGKYLFARTASLSPAVRHIAEEHGLGIINVNQGYARCSTLALSGASAAITADTGMARAMEAHDIRVLRIRAGHIALDGCKHGFIGGASFVDENNGTVYFFGDISAHPDVDAIMQFLAEYGYKSISLDGELTDFGSAVLIG